MSRISLLVLLCFLTFDAANLFGQSKTTPEGLDIYLVIGQSNMAGRAVIREQDKATLQRSYLFTGIEAEPWLKASNPMNRFSTIRKKIDMQRLGPSYSFAATMEAAKPNQEIGLVVNAKGGTKIVQWLPGTKFYAEAINQTHKALQYGRLKGVIWHQGESDSDSIRTGLYLGRLEVLVNAIREEFNDPGLPFVLGQIHVGTKASAKKKKNFNEMLLQVPGFITNTSLVTSEGLSTSDGTHFDSESAILFGQRYAENLLALLRNAKD